MPPHVLLPALVSSHTSHQFYATCFTGCRSPRELSSRSLCWLLTVFGAWGRRISRAFVFPCPWQHWLVQSSFCSTCSFLERGRSWEQGVSLCLSLLCGTHCRLSFARHLSAVILSGLHWSPTSTLRPVFSSTVLNLLTYSTGQDFCCNCNNVMTKWRFTCWLNVAVLVSLCGRFSLWPFSFGAVLVVAVLVCGRFGCHPAFLAFFPKRLGMFSPNFMCLLYVPIYSTL